MDISLEAIRDAGIVGAGGAGFPTHVKLRSQVDSVILNGAECEPLLHKDKELMRYRPDELLEGMGTAMTLTGAGQGFIGIKGKYTDVIASLQQRAPRNVSVVPLRDAYPSGDEMILVYDTLGRVVPPGGIPPSVGVVVLNIETAINVSAAGRGAPVTEKYLPVAGAVASPVTLRVPVGISFDECVQAAGGSTVVDPNFVIGGVMMGRLEADHSEVVTKTTGAIVVLPGNHCVVRRYRSDWKQVVKVGRSACDQCSFCTELCPRYLLGHPIEPHKAMRSLEFNLVGESNVAGTQFCCECNLCTMYSCPEDLDPKEVCAQNRARLASEGKNWSDPPFNPKRPAVHLENRKAPMSRLMTKLGLRRFNNVGPLQDSLLSTKRVGIKLRQHIGAPCEATVSTGEYVKRGAVVGRVPLQNGKPALGTAVHASISGRVSSVSHGTVWIEKD